MKGKRPDRVQMNVEVRPETREQVYALAMELKSLGERGASMGAIVDALVREHLRAYAALERRRLHALDEDA